MAAKTAHPDDYRMSFGEHLEELRTRMIRALIGVVLAGIVTFYFGQDIVLWLTHPLNEAQIEAGLPPHTVTPTPMSALFLYMKVSLIGALVVGAPWILYQMWLFVSAGLYAHERRVAYVLAPFSSVMSALAVLFTYFVMLPVALTFLIKFAVGFGPSNDASLTPSNPPPPGATASADAAPTMTVPQLEADPSEPKPGQMWVNTHENALKVKVGEKVLVAFLAVPSPVTPLIDLAQYIDFVMLMMLGTAVAFQLPVAMLVLGWTGIVTAGMISPYRKYMLFACFCLGAIITPSSDPLSMTLMAAPLYILFEFGLLLMKATQREEEEEDEEDEDEDDEGEDDLEDEDEEDAERAV